MRAAAGPAVGVARTICCTAGSTLDISGAGHTPTSRIITDASGGVREVEGEGVVGSQPLLHPGESFEYSGGCVLETPHGAMHGSYMMLRPDGRCF